MHEWALAESVISTVSQISKKEGLKEISEVKIVIGELQQIELDIFEFALSQLKTPELGKTKFSIKVSNAQFHCRVCGKKWSFEKGNLSEDDAEAIHFLPEVAHTYIRCPRCGSPDFEVIKGRGIWLESIKGVK
ncbi:MAG: hydrogenase nickel incorporation protein HypA [Candidatus Bathyarchaeales archaeon]